MGVCSQKTPTGEEKDNVSSGECAISLIIVQYVVQCSASSVYVQLDSDEK